MRLMHGGLPDTRHSMRLTELGHRHARHAAGTVFLLERMPDHEIAAQAGVARTFQNIRLFTGMTVLENLIVAQHNTLMRASGYDAARPPRRAQLPRRRDHGHRRRRALAGADRPHATRADDPAGDLPYGDQRRLEIARAMCTGPRLLCLDEPAAGLNPRESADLTRLHPLDPRRGRHLVLLIEHDMSVVMEISDHVVVLEYGRKISDGTADEVNNDPKVIAAYLGVEDEEVADAAPDLRRRHQAPAILTGTGRAHAVTDAPCSRSPASRRSTAPSSR